MIGERLLIIRQQYAVAEHIWQVLSSRIQGHGQVIAVAVAGESGAGKSGVAYSLAIALCAKGIPCVVLSQDDYFRLPPKTNHRQRQRDFQWVGPGEVRLDLLDAHVRALKSQSRQAQTKPLVYYDENRIGEEQFPHLLEGVVLVEGTYVTALPSVDFRFFIDRDYRVTRRGRVARGRDPDDEFIEQVLDCEHKVISHHRTLADFVIIPEDQVERQASLCASHQTGSTASTEAQHQHIFKQEFAMMVKLSESKREAQELAQRWNRLAAELGVAQKCSVQIERDGNWYVLEGWVDRHLTKGHLFSLVPQVEGAQWIVDRIRVGGPESPQKLIPTDETPLRRTA